jgi:hypothetical protein
MRDCIQRCFKSTRFFSIIVKLLTKIKNYEKIAIVEQVIMLVPEFESVVRKLEQQAGEAYIT